LVCHKLEVFLMYARVTLFPGLPPERIKATLDHFQEENLPKFEQAPGYRGMWAGVDYTGGRAIAVTYWESMEALRASDELANEIRAAAVTRAGVDRDRPPITDNYEVVIHREPART
jgi:heme-degrading monooxygenase HmoA